MTLLKAFLFGLIQGVCEFFPISSSAHLRFFDYFFHFKLEDSIILELVCNLGSACAVGIFLRKELFYLFKNKKEIKYIFLVLLPLVPIYLIFQPIKNLTYKLPLLGLFWVITSLLLFLAIFFKSKNYPISSNRKIKDVLFMGSMQTLALIPGISRSGVMIFAGTFRGWEIKETISFSYLVYIFLILGGNTLELSKALWKEVPIINIGIGSYAVGFLTSFLVGLVCVKFILSITNKRHLLPFAWYCLVIGIFCLIYFNLC